MTDSRSPSPERRLILGSFSEGFSSGKETRIAPHSRKREHITPD